MRLRAPRFPDFLCIGAQRSGTTWLHVNLAQHPSLWLPPAKEMHYFDQFHGIEAERWPPSRRRYLEGLKDALAPGKLTRVGRTQLDWAMHYANSATVDDHWYAKLFTAAPRRALLGDITPAYALLDDIGVAHVARLMPKARIIFMLRQPAERMLSGAWHELMLNRVESSLPPLEALLAELGRERCRGRSRYHQTITTWRRHFPKEQVKLIIHDEIKTHPRRVLREVCIFLGVRFSEELFPEVARPINANRALPAHYRRVGLKFATECCRGELEQLKKWIGSIPPAWESIG